MTPSQTWKKKKLEQSTSQKEYSKWPINTWKSAYPHYPITLTQWLKLIRLVIWKATELSHFIKH